MKGEGSRWREGRQSVGFRDCRSRETNIVGERRQSAKRKTSREIPQAGRAICMVICSTSLLLSYPIFWRQIMRMAGAESNGRSVCRASGQGSRS